MASAVVFFPHLRRLETRQHEGLFDLILVRWNKYEEWSPYNCILLTKEEASAHAKLENVTEVRLPSFVCALLLSYLWSVF